MNDDIFALDKFFHQTQLRVRFRDLDALQHVNHAVYLTYMESARTRYLYNIVGWEGDITQLGTILARIEVDYRLPLHFDEEFVVHTRISRLGTKSFDMLYVIKRIADETQSDIVATGKTFLVAYDYKTSQTIAVPEKWRTRITAFEKALR